MTSIIRAVAVAALLGAATAYTAPAFSAEMTVEVGGAAMYPSKTIIENAMNSKDHTTLVAAVKSAGLVDTLSGPGPFTVFAPTNEAFAKLPGGAIDMLMKPENKDKLAKILTYHVVSGKLSAEKIMADIKKMNGKAEYKTVQGATLTFAWKDKSLWVMDDSGDTAKVTIADVNQSNGVIHVIDTVLLPKM